MLKRVIIPGLLGWIVLAVCTFIINGIFGFKASIDMKQIPNERQVYEVLKANITAPGRYTCNPEMTTSGFPGNVPVYGIEYAGIGHESAGQESLLNAIAGLLAMILAAWMLSLTSARILSSYPCKVLFFVAIGLLIALYSNLPSYGIGGYPLGDALKLGAFTIFVWTLIGLVVAWRVKPEPAA